MAWTARQLYTRVKIANAWVRTGPVRISESIDQLARVAEFDLAEQPEDEPAEGDGVLIEWADFGTGTVYALFGGEVNAVEVESQPWAFTIRAVDQLSLLRRVRTGSDLDVSGMTDGEAWKAVMDYVGVTYDDADVADAGYVLGEREPVAWLIDTPASQIIGELDTVFGMLTETIGNNRVIRIPYDPTPSTSTGSYATYERGVSIDFRSNRRIHGDRDRIQNVWVVRGATAELNDQCTATPWARAAVSNPQLGSKVRVATQTFQSDLIQSEDLADKKVRWLMRQTNKLPDEGTAGLVGDPNVHPGSKIAIRDTTYGIDADPRYFLVTSVDRDGLEMTLGLTAGPGGSEGTVTTGVDKVCTDTHGDLDWPGDGFDFPDFDFPPIDLGDLIDFDTDVDWPDLPIVDPDGAGYRMTGLLNVVASPPGGTYATAQTVTLTPTYGPTTIYYTDDGSTPTTGSTVYSGPLSITTTTTLKFFGVFDDAHISPVRTEVYAITGGGGGFSCDVPLEEDWVADSGAALVVGDGSVSGSDAGQVHNTGLSVTDADSWELRATMLASSVHTVELGLTTNGIDAPYYVIVYASGEAGPGRLEVSSPDDNEVDTTDLSGSPVDVVVARDADAQTVTANFDGGAVVLMVPDTTPDPGPLFPYVRIYDLGGGTLITPSVDDIELCIGGEGLVLAAEWTALTGSWTFPGDAEAHNNETTDADAYAAGRVFDGVERVRFAGHGEFNASDECLFQLVMADTEGAATGNFAGIEAIVGATPALNVYTWDGFVVDLGADLSGLAAGFDFALDWNPGGNLMTVLVRDTDTGGILASGAWPLGTWPGDMTVHVAHGTGDAVDWDLTDLVVRVG